MSTNETGSNFIREIIDRDLGSGRHDGRVATRFPPEPNGYLHIGHAKSICLNFGIAEDYGGTCNLRFDDTNPETEDEEYVESIKEAVHWLGYEWDELRHASDYFEQFHDYAVELIEKGLAYVDSQSEEDMRRRRGTVTEAGEDSPYRDRSVEENLDLFRRMKEGEFEEGAHVLRAKIDMASPHMIMRDPLLYRIRRGHHYRRGDEWCIYPMYDFAHCLEDAIENITHSLCTLEFDNNRRVYDWVLENCLEEEELPQRPHQYEFARLEMDYTIMSKRKLLHLVQSGYVDGWDDPRLPTIFGMRRRGIRPEAIRSFCDRIGVTRSVSRVQSTFFETTVRDDLNFVAPRLLAVTDPLKVTITNYEDGATEQLNAPHWPREIDKDDEREVTFSRTLYIERDDFREDPPSDFKRLAPGREVRLRYGYFITCEEVVRDEKGNVTELLCTYDPETRGGEAPDGRQPAGTIHWLSARDAVPATFRLYDRLFEVPDPDAGEVPYTDHLNPDSLVIREGFVEPTFGDFDHDQRFQFERLGYFWQDPEDSTDDAPVFNRIVPLRDAWADRERAQEKERQEQIRLEKEREKERQRALAAERTKDPAAGLGPVQRKRFEMLVERGVDAEEAAILAESESLNAYAETAMQHATPVVVANWITNVLLGEIDSVEDAPPAASFGELVQLVENDTINSAAAKRVLAELQETDESPAQIVDRLGLKQIDDAGQLEAAARDIVEQHPDEAARYRDGKKGLIGFFMGQVMRETRGAANPEQARTILQSVLEEEA